LLKSIFSSSLACWSAGGYSRQYKMKTAPLILLFVTFSLGNLLFFVIVFICTNFQQNHQTCRSVMEKKPK